MKTVLLIFDGKDGAASTPISDSQVSTENTWSYVRPEFAGDRKFWISFRTEYSNGYVSCSTMTSDVSYDTLGGSVSAYQKIYRRSTQTIGEITVPTAPNKWETTDTEVNDNWTTHKMAATDDYPYVFSCTQYRTLGGTVQNTTVAIDTETVIDTENGFIKTNLIDVDNLLTRKATIKDNGEIVSANYQESVTTKVPVEIMYRVNSYTFSDTFTYQIKTNSSYTYRDLCMRIFDTSSSYTEIKIGSALDELYFYESDTWIQDCRTIDNASWKKFAGLINNTEDMYDGPDNSLGHPKYLYIKYSFPGPGSPKYYSFFRYSETSAIGKGFKIEANGNARFNNVVLNGAKLNNINQYIITDTGTEIFGCISQGCEGMKKGDELTACVYQGKGIDGSFRVKVTISVSGIRTIKESQIKGTIHIGYMGMQLDWMKKVSVNTQSFSITEYLPQWTWGGYAANNNPEITYVSDIDYEDYVKIQMHVTFLSDIQRGTYIYDQLCSKIHYKTSKIVNGRGEFGSWWTKLNGDGTFLAYKEYSPQARLSDRAFKDFQPVNLADDINDSEFEHYKYHRVKVSHYGNYYMTANIRLPGDVPNGKTEIDNFIEVAFSTIPINSGSTDLFRFDIELTGDWYHWR